MTLEMDLLVKTNKTMTSEVTTQSQYVLDVKVSYEDNAKVKTTLNIEVE